MKRFYVVVRDLHLYFGLFISPFVLVFAVSVIFLVHAWAPWSSVEPVSRTVTDLYIPENLENLKGRDQVNALRGVLDELGVAGEVNFIRRVPEQHRLIVPVGVPGRETKVELNLAAHSATIAEQNQGIWSALVFLHKMPGPHNAVLRGNWLYIRLWKIFADASAYLILFISVSGIYLWAVLRAERRIGMVLLTAGAFSFFGLVYAISR